jgi:hypothetical protein
MKLVEVYIAKKQSEFADHSFFPQLERGLEYPSSLSFAPDLTFWVMAFQDILRLNARFTRDAEIRKIVRHHRAEDAGHDRWFLDDLAQMKISEPDVAWIFSKKHTPTRDAAYALVSEVFRATDDRLRLVLIKTLESAGHVFFENVAGVVERAGRTRALKYFSFSHLEVEKGHEVFERQMMEKISGIQLPPRVREQAEQLVDRCYAAFGAMFDALCATEKPAVAAPIAAASALPARGRVRAQRGS